MIENLKKLRAEAGISQKQLAEAVGVSQQSINKYENHNIEPDIATLIRIAEYFNTSVDYLVGHTDVRHRIENLQPASLNAEEMALIVRYRTLTREQRICISLLADSYHTKT